MKPVSGVRRLARYALAIVSIVFLSVVTHAGRWVPDAPGSAFGVVGVQGERGYFSTQAGLVDMVNGDLMMTYADLVLPGNAGMDLAITRSYNHQTSGSKWTFGFTGVPLAAILPSSSAPSLFMADGSTRALHTGVVSGYWVTTEFWRFDTSSRTLYLPNGWVATYDSPGSGSDWAYLHEVHDVFGNSVTPTWDSSHRISSVAQTVDDTGSTHTRTVSFGYTGSGALPTSMTYGSRTWTYTYESSSPYRLTNVHPPAGPDWGFAYGSGSLTVTTPMGGTVAYGFADEDGRSAVAEVQTGGRAVTSGTWSFEYALSGTTATATVTLPSSRESMYVHAWTDGPDGKQWTLTSQSLIDGSTTVSSLSRTYENVGFLSGLPLKVPDVQTIAQGGVTFTTDYDYSASNFHDYLQPNSVTESASNHSLTRVTTNTFDYGFSSGYILPKVASTTVTIGSGSVSTSFDYNHTTGLVSSQTARGSTSTFSYDAFGNPSSGTDGYSHSTGTSYQWGVPSSITTPEYTNAITRSINSDGTVASETRNGHTTSFTYDDIKRIRVVTPATGNATTTDYASDGSTVTVSRGSFWSTTTVDGFGRPIAAENVVDEKTTATFDAEGQLTFRSMPFTGSTATGNTFAYDALGRVTTITHADASVATYSYSGTSVTFTDEISQATTQNWQMFGSPGSGRLTGVTDAASQSWAYTYNAAGSLVSVGAPSGPDRTWSYNSTTNRLESVTQPESGTTTYGYSNGRLATSTDARNLTTTYEYDGNDRLTAIVAPTSGESVTFEYDAADNRTRMKTGGMDSRFYYDAAERPWKREDKINGKLFSTIFTYDDNDNLREITYPSSREVQYDYDAAGRISKVYAGSTTYADDLSYHPTGALHEASFGNGTSLSLSLDARARPDHLVSGPLDQTYSYYDNGNVSAIDDARSSNYSSGFSYDALNRLTGVSGFGGTSFTYDALGNRATKGSGSPQVTYSYSSTTLRLTSASSSLGTPETGTFTYDAVGNMTGDGTGTYGYSSHNQMLSATLSSTTTRYQYDASGLRALKSGPTGQSYYIHGPNGALLAEYVGSFSKESPWPSVTGLPSTVTLTWGAVASATYEICIDITDDHSCSGSWTSMGSATTTTLSNLPAGTYYWQVRATTSGSTTQADAGAWWRFSVASTGVFNKVGPVNGATVYTTDVTLSWNALPDVGYSVCWDTTNNNSCDGSWWPNGASLSRTLEALDPGTYYWQVREWDGTNTIEADAGSWWSFTKVSGVSGKFSPENGTSGHGSSVWLNWSAVEDSAYWVCWDTTDNGECDSSWVPNGGSTTKLLEGLSAGSYYWQVQVQTGGNYVQANGGTWWRFTVGADTGEPGSGSASVTREYIYLGSMLLASVESGSTLTYYHADALGSVRAVTSASGSTLSRVDYHPFGENTASLSGDPRKFIGGEQDAETAFDYLGARYYRNVWGRFTSVDPVMSADALTNPQLWNRYSYALNSPLRFSDPSGMAVSEREPYPEAAYGGANRTFHRDSLEDWVRGYIQYQDDNGNHLSLFGASQEPDKRLTDAEKQREALNRSIAEANTRIINNPACANLFGGLDNALNRLGTVRFSFIDRPYGTDGTNTLAGAYTIRSNGTSNAYVFINSSGPFLTGMAFNPGLGAAGAFQNLDFGANLSVEDRRAVTILHELGHVTGHFLPDAGNALLGLNQAYTNLVVRVCFPGR